MQYRLIAKIVPPEISEYEKFQIVILSPISAASGASLCISRLPGRAPLNPTRSIPTAHHIINDPLNQTP